MFESECDISRHNRRKNRWRRRMRMQRRAPRDVTTRVLIGRPQSDKKKRRRHHRRVTRRWREDRSSRSGRVVACTHYHAAAPCTRVKDHHGACVRVTKWAVCFHELRASRRVLQCRGRRQNGNPQRRTSNGRDGQCQRQQQRQRRDILHRTGRLRHSSRKSHSWP